MFVPVELNVAISAGRILHLAIRDRSLDFSREKSQFYFLPAEFKILPDFDFDPDMLVANACWQHHDFRLDLKFKYGHNATVLSL